MALSDSEMKSLDVMVWRLSSRIHRQNGGDSDDCDSSEERDIIKRAKKVIKEHLKDVSVDTMTRIQQENNQKKEAAKLKKAEKAKAAAKNTKKATNELGDEGGEGGAASSVKVWLTWYTILLMFVLKALTTNLVNHHQQEFSGRRRADGRASVTMSMNCWWRQIVWIERKKEKRSGVSVSA